MKLHAVQSIKANKVWVRNTACFCDKCFNDTFQPSTCCKGWKEFSVVKMKTHKEKKDKEEEVSHAVIEPKVNDYVAAVYDRKVYIRKVQVVEDNDAYIYFLQHNGTLTRNSKLMTFGFFLMISCASLQSLLLQNGLFKFVQRRLILSLKSLRTGKDDDDFKYEQ